MAKPLCLTLLFVSISVAVAAQPSPERQDDETAIRSVVAGLTQAWTDGDGEAWGSAFADDADFTVWFGLPIAGRDEIARGHAFIFDSVYAGTTYHLNVRGIRFLGPDVAVVHLEGRVASEGAPLPENPDSVPLAVMAREADGWKIVAFQNTPHLIDELGGRSVPLSEIKAAVSEAFGH